MKLVNATPHAINLRSADGTDTVLPKAENPARVNMTIGTQENAPEFPCALFSADTKGDIIDLPAPQKGTFVVVSALVGDALIAKNIRRHDVLVLGTGPKDGAVRNADGQIIAVTRLKRVF
jgi:hypothetical protein